MGIYLIPEKKKKINFLPTYSTIHHENENECRPTIGKIINNNDDDKEDDDRKIIKM